MPDFAFSETLPLPGFPGTTVTAGQAGVDELAQIFRNGPCPLVVDIETFGIGKDAGPGRIKCVILSTNRSAVVLNPRVPGQAAEIRRALDYASTLIMHKAEFDALSLYLNRMLVHEHVDKIVCTLLLARLAEPGDTTPRDLDACCKRYLGTESKPIQHLFKAMGYSSKTEGFLHLDIDSPAYLMGAGSDGIATALVWPLVHKAAVERQLNHPFGDRIGLSRAGAEDLVAQAHEANRWALERTLDGVLYDPDYLQQYQNKVLDRTQRGRGILTSYGISNGNRLLSYLDSIGEVPADHRRTPVKINEKTGKETGGKLGTAQDDVALLSHPLARVWALVAENEKMLGYLEKCRDMADVNGRIHPTTTVYKAAHGRDAMADPPVHQFPGDARAIMIADPGREFTSVDWSQQEPRVIMNLAGDIGRPLLDYENHGTKIYQGIADYAEIPLDMAKVVVLAGLYGEGVKKLSIDLGLPFDPWMPESVRWGKVVEAHYGYAAAKDLQAQVFGAMPRTAGFLKQGKQIAREHRVAWCMDGRIVPIPSGTYNGEWSVQAHKWPNYNTSGSASAELHWTIVQARRAGYGMQLKWGMHDEIICDREVSRDVQRLMETPHPRLVELAGRVPVIRTDLKHLGNRWGKA